MKQLAADARHNDDNAGVVTNRQPAGCQWEEINTRKSWKSPCGNQIMVWMTPAGYEQQAIRLNGLAKPQTAVKTNSLSSCQWELMPDG